MALALGFPGMANYFVTNALQKRIALKKKKDKR
jgi:hypothetical protein